MIYKKYAEVLQIASPLYVQHTLDFSPMILFYFVKAHTAFHDLLEETKLAITIYVPLYYYSLANHYRKTLL